MLCEINPFFSDLDVSYEIIQAHGQCLSSDSGVCTFKAVLPGGGAKGAGCQKLHGSETNAQTPVVFVTPLGDFEENGRSILSGGADLVAKPFMLNELAVKALQYTLRDELCSELRRLQNTA